MTRCSRKDIVPQIAFDGVKMIANYGHNVFRALVFPDKWLPSLILSGPLPLSVHSRSLRLVRHLRHCTNSISILPITFAASVPPKFHQKLHVFFPVLHWFMNPEHQHDITLFMLLIAKEEGKSHGTQPPLLNIVTKLKNIQTTSLQFLQFRNGTVQFVYR